MDGKELLCSSKRLTKLVEGRWTVVRTRVRFPSTPLREMLENATFSAFLFYFATENAVLDHLKPFQIEIIGVKIGVKM